MKGRDSNRAEIKLSKRKGNERKKKRKVRDERSDRRKGGR